MTRSELRERLRAEVRRWEQKTFQDLTALTYPVTYDTGRPGETGFFQTEVTVLEETPEYVHLAVAVSDGGVQGQGPARENRGTDSPAEPRTVRTAGREAGA